MIVKPPLIDEAMAALNLLLRMIPDDGIIRVDYTNWRGERAQRRITPVKVWYGKTEWHPTPTILLEAYDHGKREYRDFKVTDFHMETLTTNLD